MQAQLCRQHPIRIIGRNGFIFAWSLTFLIRIDPVLLLACLPLGLLMLVVGSRVSHLQRSEATSHKQHSARAIAWLLEAIAACRELTVFNLWGRQARGFCAASEGVASARRSSSRFGSALTSLVDALWPVATVVCLLLGGYRVIAGQLTPGGLMAFVWYVQWVIHPLSQIANYQAEVQSSLVSASRVEELLNWLVRDPASPQPVVMSQSLELHQVTFAYGDTTVLHGVDLRVEAGEVIALVGKTGSGKSTVLKLALGLLTPTGGQVLIDDRPATADQLRGSPSFAAVFQDPFLFAGLSVRDNVLLAAACPTEVERALLDANAVDIAATETTSTLSGGQRQRAALARALARCPSLVVLDEATAAVDSATEEEICRALFERRDRDRMAGIVVSHRLSSIMGADQIYMLHSGRVIGQGTHQQLLASCPEYRELYRAQMTLQA